jgi:hypothetical protein
MDDRLQMYLDKKGDNNWGGYEYANKISYRYSLI